MAPEHPQLLLPFAEREYISVKRAAIILGVSYFTIFDLLRDGRLDAVDYRKRAWKRVRYASVVELCNRIAAEYQITLRRPNLTHAVLRHRDEDLLPFPLDDTISMQDAMRILGYERPDSVRNMIEEGFFAGYKLCENAPWRISRSSLAAFLERVHSRRPSRTEPVSAARN